MVFRFRTFIVFLILTGTISFFIACNPSRKAIKAPLKEEGADYLFNKLKEHELKFNWLSAKFSAEYENDGTTFSFSGQIRVRKDSLIWITLTPMLGIEAVRIMISQDSLKMINKLNDTYFIGDYEYLNRFLNTNIDYDILQAFLIGNDLQSYENSKFKASIDRGEYKLSTSERQKLKKFVRNTNENLKVYIQNIWLDSQTFKITFADVRELRRENIKLEAVYLEFEDIQGQLFPKKMEFNIRADNNIRVATEFNKISINIPLQFPFKIPSSYKQIR
jgi:hypothetical protein